MRRRTAAGIAVLVILALFVAWVIFRPYRQAPATPPAQQVAATEAVPGPVLLVPGYGGGRVPLEALAARLRAAGREATVVRLAGDGTGDLREQARGLDAVAREALARGATSVDVVGFSAGGVVARLWAAELGGAHVARRVVTIGSPHRGTSLAGLAASLLPASCPEACRQLVPEGPLLAALEETPDGPTWVSVWTALDEVVRPAESAVLDGAVNVRLQDVCADVAAAHGGLPADPLVAGLVVEALTAPAPLSAPPAAADCLPLRAVGAA